MPAATQALLEDSAVNIDEWIAAEVEQAFAVQEGTAFVSGDGTNKPKGFLSYTTVANASWEWGKLGYVATGEAGDFPASDPSDVLVDLIYALKAGYRQNGVFVMNRKTQATVRKFKDYGRRLSLAAAGDRGRPRLADDVRGDRGRGHAGRRRQQLLGGVRRFPPRLSDRRPPGRAGAARSVLGQALRAVLHHQAGRRRRAGLRRDQAAEVRGELRAAGAAPGVRVGATQHCINDAAATPRRFVLARYAAARISSDTTHMFQDHPAWVAHQRARWLRPDAHLFVRPDAHRFMPPGAPRLTGKDAVRYFWPDPASDRRAQALDHTHDAQLAAARASLARLKRDVAALAFELKFRRLLREKAYNPDQPRVPAGNPDGGQWMDGNGTARACWSK